MAGPSKFAKYDEQGPYHWKRTFPERWFRSSPRQHARYDVPLKCVRDRVGLSGRHGLDIGCGDGVFLYKAAREGSVIVGLDAEESGVREAKSALRLRNQESRLIVGDGTRLPMGSRAFDYVTGIELVEHLSAPKELLVEAKRVLRPGGVFLCTTPTRPPDQPAEQVRDPFHVHEFTVVELKETLEEVFGAVDVYGAYPMALDRWYVEGTGVRLLDKALRLGVKLTALLANPYTTFVTERPDWRWNMLVGVAQKA